ncbi:hypothetical protein GCM10007082_07950 [Oceanisphaera arctica]|nr:hypothetical protein GCM10007082_07950 [Oceanisphaera arctica]
MITATIPDVGIACGDHGFDVLESFADFHDERLRYKAAQYISVGWPCVLAVLMAIPTEV